MYQSSPVHLGSVTLVVVKTIFRVFPIQLAHPGIPACFCQDGCSSYTQAARISLNQLRGGKGKLQTGHIIHQYMLDWLRQLIQRSLDRQVCGWQDAKRINFDVRSKPNPKTQGTIYYSFSPNLARLRGHFFRVTHAVQSQA